MRRSRQRLLSTARIFCVLLVIFSAIFLQAAHYSRLETTRGDNAFQRQEYKIAVAHYEKAIKWYTPFSRSVQYAIERLWQIGVTAEKHDDLSLALDAYWSLRASLYAVQSFYTPYQQWLLRVEERIAPVMARQEHDKKQQLEPSTFARDRERFAAMLRRKTSLDRDGVILTELGFLGWIGATIGFIWYALGNNQVWLWKRCLFWGSSMAIFFTVWIIGMLLA